MDSSYYLYQKLSYQQKKRRQIALDMIKSIRRETSKQMRQKCQICESKFQMLVNVEHLCKRCHRYICEKCAPKRIKIFQAEGHSSVHKCCSICIRQEDIISSQTIKYKLVFGQNSLFADEWFKKMNKEKTSYNEILNEYNQKIFDTNPNIIRFKSESQRILSELCEGQNYSLRQLTGRLMDEVGDQMIKEKVSNTIISIYSYLKEMPFNYQLVYLVTYLLCFCNELNTYFILTRFIEKIFPQYLKIQKVQKDNVLSHQLKMIIDMYKVLAKKTDKEQLDKILKYLQKKFTTFIKSFLVNVTNVSISFYLIDQMLKNASYIYLYKAIATLIFLSRQTLYQEREENITEAIQLHVLRNLQIEQIKSTMINFQKSAIKFEMDHQFFESAEHRKLHQKYKQLQSMYQKSQQMCRSLDSKYSSLLKKYDKLNLMYAEQNRKVLSLQEELLGIADKLIMIEDVDKIKEQCSLAVKRNSFLIQESSRLKKELQDLKKRQFMYGSQKFIFQKVKGDYNRQIVDLKTKNQLYEIQKLINNQIDFNTSVIEDKIKLKNQRIAQLETVNNQIQMEIDFYRQSRPTQSRPQNPFSANVSIIQKTNFEQSKMSMANQNNSLNLSGIQVSSKEDNDQFKKYLVMSKEITEKLKSQLHESQSKNKNLQKEVVRLEEDLRKLRSSMQINKEINVFINQIPEQMNYSLKVGDLQRFISKQSNIHKKTELEQVLSCMRKCIYEVRYRTIDAKLKQKKIKQLFDRSQLNDVNNSLRQLQPPHQSKQQSLRIENDQNANLQQMLGWMGKEEQLLEANRASIKREECQVM